MADFTYRADANDAQESQFDLVPTAEYIAIIEESDFGPNDKKTGQILTLQYQIVSEGPFKGRKLFEVLNIEHESQQAEQISRRALNAICVACGVMELKDSSQLHGIPMKLDVGVTKDDPVYGKRNKIRKHIKLENGTQPVSASNSGQSVPGGQSTTTDQSTTDPAPVPNGQPQKKQPWEK